MAKAHQYNNKCGTSPRKSLKEVSVGSVVPCDLPRRGRRLIRNQTLHRTQVMGDCGKIWMEVTQDMDGGNWHMLEGVYVCAFCKCSSIQLGALFFIHRFLADKIAHKQT